MEDSIFTLIPRNEETKEVLQKRFYGKEGCHGICEYSFPFLLRPTAAEVGLALAEGTDYSIIEFRPKKKEVRVKVKKK